MSKALYRKYRSKSLAEIVGQEHITDMLTRALKAGKVAHAYLFTGPRGVGKTSIARILAHEINQLPYSDDSTHLDIIEIDAASNNGVEDVRDLREKVQIAPVSAAKKVYIIDEVHMLSKAAFNALLKTLEEPPEHIVFILATTDVEKLPATIVSRTQRYGFRSIQPDQAITHLKHIAKEEGITITDDALALIAERGDGSFRDSISLLDQLSSLTNSKEGITASLVEDALGLASQKIVDDLLKAVEDQDVSAVAQTLLATEANGVSPIVITEQLIRHLRGAVTQKTEFLSLLDALLDVPRSTQPSAKLLTVLGMAATPHKVKTAALAAPALEVSATIEELSEQATKKHPVVTAPVAVAPRSAAPAPAKPKAATPKVAADSATEDALAKPETPIKDGPLDWPALLEYARKEYVALYSVLSKCDYEVEGETLTLYTVNPFYKKKLDDTKYSTHLYDSMRATGGHELVVNTVPTRAPMKDSQAAAIADIMGGGVQVSPEAA